jgi:hypothetical protein
MLELLISVYISLHCFFYGFWENLCFLLVTCCMTVQSAIFYITKIVDSATILYTVYHVI